MTSSSRTRLVPLILALLVGAGLGVGAMLIIPSVLSESAAAKQDVEHACLLLDRVDLDDIDVADGEVSPIWYDLSSAAVLAESAANRDDSYAPLHEALTVVRSEIVLRFDLDSPEAREALAKAREICKASA